MLRSVVGLLALLGIASAAAAQEPVEPERCPRLIAYDTPRIMPANDVHLAQATVPDTVRLTFVGHATFLIESPAGVTIATDYNGVAKPAVIPRIATMNRAHGTHFTLNPEPEIEFVLHGWGEGGQPADHRVTVDDVWIWNVTTNIRGGFGQSGSIQRDMNSIFVFEVAGLCIAHLGHLHHELTAEHLKALGRIDVVLAPVDGGYTLSTDDMIAVLDAINAPLVIPMHYFGGASLARFLARLGETYAIERSATPTVELSRDTLPPMRTLLVLPGY